MAKGEHEAHAAAWRMLGGIPAPSPGLDSRPPIPKQAYRNHFIVVLVAYLGQAHNGGRKQGDNEQRNYVG
jgi:hypothetical protein